MVPADAHHLRGHVALVTGSNKGIGAAIARRLAQDGAQITITGRDEDAAQHAAGRIHAETGRHPLVVVGDIGDPAMVDMLVNLTVERFGGIDVLVNNAWGGTRVNRLENKKVAQFDESFRVAFTPALRLMQATFPFMRDRGWGRVVNIGSLNGVNAHAFTADYNAVKEALRALTRTAAREWFQHGIVANVVCPMARVERHDRAWGSNADSVAADVGSRLPAGRMGDPMLDIAGVVSFLCSDEAQYLTGNTVFVDGGGHISGVPWEPMPEEDAAGVPVESAIHRTGNALDTKV